MATQGLLRFLQRRTILFIPLLHTALLIIMISFIGRIASNYTFFYERRPILTLAVTNAVLGGISDTLAQTFTAIRHRRLKAGQRDKTIFLELDEKIPYSQKGLLPESRTLPPPFEFDRLVRFMSFGMFNAPILYNWFGFLDRTFPVPQGTLSGGFGKVLMRVGVDQCIFAPIGLCVFFTFMGLSEGHGISGVKRKLNDGYSRALGSNFVVWPAVQFINFKVMPLRFQIPFVSTVGIFWTMYLSLTNASDV
ncbi:Protein sym1 [Neolecta irregularis DAH-3]|uniref:Protein sym1 n=1 Tax=Neolecta irregularis (strain DAH-3) TaxID=1198029 RepID=A0A1U7LPQ0_NEOID|nr:Protein sym1 [Neolecta irregularis DAH-3]|eukprot:OLL24563.1 Protein sym1 [Neolecta irregularis DAH-3]